GRLLGVHAVGTINTLEAASRAGVKRYVLSSSSKAVESTVYDQPHKLTKDTFNHKAISKARSGLPTDASERALTMYSASRTTVELAFWHWLKTNNPPFVANCVIPDGIFGHVLDVRYVNIGFTLSLAILKRVLPFKII
ncbi:hypothetical protein CI102_15418, partial [Trichoderma harzianum]